MDQNLDLRGKDLVYINTFDCLVFKFSLESFGAFPIFADLVPFVSRQRLIIERNGPKFGPQG